mmetsp:Transcript_4918/g.8481  ORF Transcript_4918/g.8481 Transcript_4918/m.8481 type:complete len:411 (+) Transcript_4918:664-1896(+)
MQLPNPSVAGASASMSPTNGTGCTQNAGAPTPVPSQNLLTHGQLNLDKHPMLLHTGFAPSASTQSQPNFSTSAQMGAPIIMSRNASVGMQSPTITHQDVKHTGLDSLSKPTPPCANQPNLMAAMMVQAPCGFEIQVKNFDQNSMSPLPRNTYENEGKVDALSSYQASAFAKDNQSISGPDNYFDSYDAALLPTEGLKKRHISELVRSIGYSFPPLRGGKRFNHIPAATASCAVSTSTSEPSSNEESDNLSSSNEACTYSNDFSKPGNAVTVKSENLRSNNDIPDLLSGFDKHVASMKKTVAKTDVFENRPVPEDSHFFAVAGGIGESPCITSKSFEELHQFLGKGISSDKMPHLDLNQSIGNYQPVYNGTCCRSTSGANDVSKQIRFPPSLAAFPHSCHKCQYLHSLNFV